MSSVLDAAEAEAGSESDCESESESDCESDDGSIPDSSEMLQHLLVAHTPEGIKTPGEMLHQITQHLGYLTLAVVKLTETMEKHIKTKQNKTKQNKTLS